MYYISQSQLRMSIARKPIILVLAALFSNTAFVSNAAFAEENTDIDVAPVSVTGNPLGVSSDELVVPINVLNGRELSLQRQGTLGETLNGIPGVTATQFGPNASRPVIRGLDAERVRILQNGVGILDASSLSFDHAVAVDPLVIEQIDVIRGPASLLYGGSAVGGVVNAIDHRIPKEKLEGVTGRAETRFGGPDNTRNGAIVLDAGNGQFAIHADAYSRETSDLKIPGFARSERSSRTEGLPRENRGKLINSSAENDGGALGASLTFDNGYIGTSFSAFNSNYGVVAEEDVRIDMQSQRWDIASEFTDLGSIVNRVKLRMAYTDYEHVELAGGEPETVFKNRGLEGTFEAGHAPVQMGFGQLQGVIGLQFQNTNFEASGDEAFVPSTNTQSKALYVYEELPLSLTDDKLKLTAGARFGHHTVDSKDDARFGTGQNASFNPDSYALGSVYQLDDYWSLAGNLSHNERAPSYFELYANGEHAATGQFEIGNPNFDVERSKGVDAQIRWKNAKNAFSVSAYYTRFSNFIGLFDTDNVDPDEGTPIAQFSNVGAVFKGLEAEGRFNLAQHLDLTLRGDYVHASDRDNGGALPRISPLRLGAGLIYQKNSFGARINMLRAFNQNRTADNELATDGYTDVSAMVTYKLPTKLNVELFARANNLLNEEIREHASFLKEISVAGERTVLVGLRADF
ncbi:MAG: TonB-dependent receptor [Pseudomonadota bacterium]